MAVHSFNQTIVAGLTLGNADIEFLPKVVALAKRLKARLHLVHAVEPAAASAWVETYYTPDLGIELEILKASEAELEKICQNLVGEIEVSYHAILAPAASALCSEAISKRASCICVGVAGQPSKFLPQGFSTALSTMAMAERPVIALSKSLNIDFSKDPIRAMIADDLQPESRRGIAKAISMAIEWGATKLVHVHVMPPLPIESTRLKLHNFFGTKWPDEGADGFFEERFEESKAKLSSMLSGRLDSRLAELQANHVEYVPVITHGRVTEKMSEVAAEYHVNLAFFGHHRIFHPRPMTLGKMPLNAMIDGRFASVIIP